MHKSHHPGSSAGGAGALPDALADTSGGARCLCAGFQLSERVRLQPRAENRLGPGHIPGHRAAVVVSHMNEYSSTSPVVLQKATPPWGSGLDSRSDRASPCKRVFSAGRPHGGTGRDKVRSRWGS